MSVLFSRECEYALQAVMYLARKSDGDMTSIRELTQSLRIPYHFLAKILQRLKQKGLLVSTKGPSGGFALRTSDREVTLFDIVDAIDGASFTRSCVLGFPRCSGKHPCAVHHEWSEIRDTLHHLLSGKSVAHMSARTKKPGYEVATR